MIEAISTNGLLAIILGPGKATASRGASRGDSGEPAAAVSSPAAAYAQPSDVVELSGAGGSVPVGSGQTASLSGERELTEEQQQEVRELKQRDAEVRRHEQAHKAAAGAHANGGPTFEYQTGPDGKRYAVGGEVSIDTSPVAGDPQATIAKMQQIRRAALAPAQPSGQDRAVAAQAQSAEQTARAELAKERRDGAEAASGDAGTSDRATSFFRAGITGSESRRGAQLNLLA